MRNLLLALLICSPLAALAAVDANFRDQPLCVDMAEMEMPYAYEVFCNSSKTYDRFELCGQLECLVNWHITHCDPVLQESVRYNVHSGVQIVNGYPALLQGSEALSQIENAQERYCY